MPSFSNPFRRTNYRPQEAPRKNPLIDYFNQILERDDSPFELATDDLQEMLQTVESEQALLAALTSACMQCSLTATIDEKFLEELAQDSVSQMLAKSAQYIQESNLRARQVAEHGRLHMAYLNNYAYCDGCAVCEYHEDVKALLHPYEEKNLDFFIHLFVGMKTINYAFLSVIGELLKSLPEHQEALRPQKIWELRQYIYQKAEGLYRQLIS